MSKLPYKLINLDNINLDEAVGEHVTDTTSYPMRWLIIPLSIFFCIIQIIATIILANKNYVFVTSTLIPTMAFGFLFILLLLINPGLKLTRFSRILRPFNRAELTAIFCAMVVTSGISTIGLTSKIVPLVSAPFNPEWNTKQRGWNEGIIPHLNKSLYITDTQVIQTFREGITETIDGRILLKPVETEGFWDIQGNCEWIEYSWEVFKAIPWPSWIKPLSWWMIFIFACYGLFYSLTYLVLDYWHTREKMVFPLAKIPESLLPDANDTGHWIPRIFRTPSFWIGFSISGFVLSWNACHKWLPGTSGIRLGLGYGKLNAILEQSFLSGLVGDWYNSLEFIIVFTGVGLGFLLPVHVSFSTWFYHVAAKILLLAMVWMGYAKNIMGLEPPSNGWWLNNPQTGIGAGAMFTFSFICLYRCIKDFCYVIPTKKTLWRQFTTALPLIGLVLSFAVIVAWLNWNKLPVFWGIIFVFAFMLLSLGIMRIVAEGGIYWIRSHATFFHLYRMLGVGRFLQPVLLAPIMPIYSIFFIQIKTLIAPSLLNSAKMYQDQKRDHLMYHMNIIIAIFVSVLFSIGFAIFWSHIGGAQSMSAHLYSNGPRGIITTANMMLQEEYTALTMDFSTMGWYFAGATLIIFSIFTRQRYFWFPHPIGLVMLMNPMMHQIWFGFFIGWIFKKTAIKYGGKPTYDKLHAFFIGLIMGELIAIFFWQSSGLLFGTTTRYIDLNRWGP